ncbi:malonic semialdehyde reductase [Cupriavidus basilensis]|uniref:malonic semialdehyde reductase n=1 Tax=Cupriavidus basilensis TaxID=68895 RepID=UPI00157B872C|nr:malonic semialdehyde reductase [Cupriavidus basilensis]NUA26911.1 malonic semialdehyde reductase [Cupriavidus basilensis]
MNEDLCASALTRAFLDARTYYRFTDRPVEDGLLQRLYENVRWGPTALNCQPARLIFIKSPEAKARLCSVLSPGNVGKVSSAPVTAVVAWDTEFFTELPTLFPNRPSAKDAFAADHELARMTAIRNGTLQGGYLIVAARLLGLDVGPMSGFDEKMLNAEFFPDSRWRVNFLANLGYGEPDATHPRGPRLAFEETCRIA